MKGANEVFTHRVIHARLTTYRRVHLSQKRRWHLYEIRAAQKTGRGKPCHVSHHTATKGDKQATSLVPVCQRRIEYLLDRRHIFMGLARRHHHLGHLPSTGKRCFNGLAVERAHQIIRHQDHASPLDRWLPNRRIHDQPTPNLDRITPVRRGRGKINMKCV